jgi:phage terminase large subunit-like protein
VGKGGTEYRLQVTDRAYCKTTGSRANVKKAARNRADPIAAQCKHGLVKLVEGAWNRAFIEELCAFPRT